MSSKTKTGLTESIPSKATPASPRVTKLSKTIVKSDSAPLQSSRLSTDRSVNSKPSVDRRSPKPAVPTERPQNRVARGSELQAQLTQTLDELKKANEQIALLEKEKRSLAEELKQAQEVSGETNGKLEEALLAQRKAQEDSEIEKFRAVELEQTGIEATRRKEEEWQKEIDAIKNQHALDVASLLSATDELEKIKQELAMITDAKNKALSHADDATRIAEVHAAKAEQLSTELSKHKALLEAKVQGDAAETDKMTMRMQEEIEFLNLELVKAKDLEEKLAEKEANVEQLSIELEAAKMSESYAHKLAEEWQHKFEEFEKDIEQSGKLERSASESLGSVMRQLEESNDSLHEAEAQIDSLKEKVGLLEMTIGTQKKDLEDSEKRIISAKGESSSMVKEIELLKTELEAVKEEKFQALENEKLAASSVQSLLEEKNKLINEIENAKVEEEKSKKAMESLASALHEVSAEAREAKEMLMSHQVEKESNENQIEDLKLVLKTTNEKYESMVDDAKHENDTLLKAIEESKNELEKLKAESGQKEQELSDSLKKSELKNVSLEKEIDRLVNLLKLTEEEACTMREEQEVLQRSLKEARSELASLQEAMENLKAENSKLQKSHLDKETELQNIVQENVDVRGREAAALTKMEELSKLLEEATTRGKPEENGELSESEKDYALLPKVVEFSEENGHVEEKTKVVQSQKPNEEDGNENSEKDEGNNTKMKEEKSKDDDGDSVEFKMWESCQIEKPEQDLEQDECFDEDESSKADVGESYDQINGFSPPENAEDGSLSPTKQSQKKKKHILKKIGSLLKKKGASSPV